jgi:hypothetical protein
VVCEVRGNEWYVCGELLSAPHTYHLFPLTSHTTLLQIPQPGTIHLHQQATSFSYSRDATVFLGIYIICSAVLLRMTTASNTAGELQTASRVRTIWLYCPLIASEYLHYLSLHQNAIRMCTKSAEDLRGMNASSPSPTTSKICLQLPSDVCRSRAPLTPPRCCCSH